MGRTQKITFAVSGVIIVALVALAAPSAIATASWASDWLFPRAQTETAPAAAPSKAPPTPASESSTLASDDADDVASDPGRCTSPAWIVLGRMNAHLSRDLVDQGARELAAGTVGLGDDGQITTYTVAPGDALYAIGDRFCIRNVVQLESLNHTRMIHPGETLLLRPDPAVPWVPYFIPNDAPADYQQIPYQRAIEDMSTAAHGGDLGTMRAIFTERLSGMFPDPKDAEMIALALERGDLDVLRQMFA